MKIHLTSCETHPGAWRHQEERLRELWSYSSRRHSLVDDPAEADLIIVGNLREENGFRSLRLHPIVNRFPAKCFGVSDVDQPLPLLRGIYTSAHKRLPFRSRDRSGCYALYHADFRNPFVESHPGLAFVAPKKYLFSFTGRESHAVRREIFRRYQERADCFVRNTSEFNLFTHEQEGKLRSQAFFVQVLEASKFALCPRGAGAASIRLFEAMRLGVAPIIVADRWILPKGPDWKSFALFVPEKEVHRVSELAERNEARHQEMGRAAADAYARCFARDTYFDYLIEQMDDIRRHQRVPEVLHWKLRNLAVLHRRVSVQIRRRTRRLRELVGRK